MPESKCTKNRIHAPWSKKVLVPLWFVQFGFALVEFGWSTSMLVIAVHSGPDSGISHFGKITEAINAPLHLILCTMILFTFVYFARFRLTTQIFQLQSFFAVAIGVISTALSFGGGANGDFDNGGDIMGGIWCAIHLLASIALLGYVISVRKAVLNGQKMEMESSTLNGSSTLHLDGMKDSV